MQLTVSRAIINSSLVGMTQIFNLEADLEKVKQGIEAVGNMELNSALEDFE